LKPCSLIAAVKALAVGTLVARFYPAARRCLPAVSAPACRCQGVIAVAEDCRMRRRGRLHHLELWMDDATSIDGPWSWLLQRLGYTVDSTWATGRSWVSGDAYIVLESGPAHVRGRQERLRSGMNHLALWAGTRDELDALVIDACQHGWSLMFADKHPHAGGPDTYAAYLEDASGFEVELVAEDAPPSA